MRLIGLCLALVLVVGCTQSKDSDSNPIGRKATSKDEALGWLTPERRSHFESWQNQVLKSCSASDAFTRRAPKEEPTVDALVMLARNQNSIVFKDRESWAVVDSYKEPSGQSSSKVQETATINGKTDAVSARAERVGSTCNVYLFDQLVYSTSLLETISVGAYWVPGRVLQSNPVSPKQKNLASGFAQLEVAPLIATLSDMLGPDDHASQLVAGVLGLNGDQARRYVQISSWSWPSFALRLAGERSALWTHSRTQSVVAQANALQSRFSPSAASLALEMRVPVPQFKFADHSNSADLGTLRLLVNLDANYQASALTFTTRTVQQGGVGAFSSSEALNCAEARAKAYIGAVQSRETVQPAVQDLFSPCDLFHNHFEELSYSSGLVKSLIASVLAGVDPRGVRDYLGWDRAVKRLALAALQQNLDVRSELDPRGLTAIVPALSQMLRTLQDEMRGMPHLQGLTESIFDMGMQWVLKGLNVDGGRIHRILISLDNVSDVFAVSAQRLFEALSVDPFGQDHVIDFAAQIDSNYKSQALKAYQLAQELEYADFAVVFNNLLQSRLQLSTLSDYVSQFTTVRDQMQGLPQLKAVKPQLVPLTVKWVQNRLVDGYRLRGILEALANVAEPFAESTRTLVNDLSRSLDAQASALNYARALTAADKQAALQIRDLALALGYDRWATEFFASVLQKQPSSSELVAGTQRWQALTGFQSREKARVQGDLSALNDWNLKKAMDLAVNEQWLSEDLAAFEAIAPVAQGKNACGHYKSMSSLAECAGMSLFSRQKGKFFDPAFAGRYMRLAQDFVGYVGMLADPSSTQLRWQLADGFFGSFDPIWHSCDASLFAQKANTLKSHMQALAGSDQIKRWELERAIRDTLGDCR